MCIFGGQIADLSRLLGIQIHCKWWNLEIAAISWDEPIYSSHEIRDITIDTAHIMTASWVGDRYTLHIFILLEFWRVISIKAEP